VAATRPVSAAIWCGRRRLTAGLWTEAVAFLPEVVGFSRSGEDRRWTPGEAAKSIGHTLQGGPLVAQRAGSSLVLDLRFFGALSSSPSLAASFWRLLGGRALAVCFLSAAAASAASIFA